uniref:DUF569 domain-containing protein n=3 Tax=Zea mays TaxID=4577 RepID=A0A804R0D8_MAIZE
MQFFPDRAHLRLRSRWHGMYLHAEEDGVRITLRRRRGTLNEAWVVHHLERNGVNYVLLHSAAYGRYLAIVSMEATPAPSSGQGQGARRTCLAVQRLYDAPGQNDVLWQFRFADDGSDDVVMRNRVYGTWHNYGDERRLMQFIVEAIPPRAEPPELPPVVWPPAVPIGGPIRRQRRRVVQAQPVLRRKIHYVRADDQGNFSPLVWRMLWFDGRSVLHLRRDLAAELGVGEANVLDITMCVRAGSNGRLTPLVIDLPFDEQAMDIVVLATDSPAAEALVHPDVAAP